jgi:polysaccharide pyruvyl transferase WcaK-like protein
MEGLGRMTKIFIYGTHGSASIGVHAMAICIMAIIDRFIPHAQFTILSKYPHLDHKRYDQYNFNLRMVEYGVSKLEILFAVLKECTKADIVIVEGGDGLTDERGISFSIKQNFSLLLVTFMKKPVIIFPSSVGPYNTKFTRFLARLSLNRVKSITAREEITKNYLQEIGIKSPVYFTADAAFILKPAPHERMQDILSMEGISKDNGLLIGMNISQLINYRSKSIKLKCDYIELMARVADYLVDNLNATVIFIPHEIFPKELKELELRKSKQKT